jgi:PleD family two-component response regulator
MQSELKSKRVFQDLNVLLVGNNPIELSKVFDNIRSAPGSRILTEIAFDIKTIFERLVRFRPNYILIDDNIGKAELKNAIKMLGKDRKTKDIPIAILKNSNYEEVFSVGVMDYILKENINGQSLYTALTNSLKFRRTQLYLYKALKKRKVQLKRLASNQI